MEAVLAWRHSYGEDADARAAAVEATRRLEPLLLETVRARRDRPEADAVSLLPARRGHVAYLMSFRRVALDSKPR